MKKTKHAWIVKNTAWDSKIQVWILYHPLAVGDNLFNLPGP